MNNTSLCIQVYELKRIIISISAEYCNAGLIMVVKEAEEILPEIFY